jgi:uncharacterized MAPEG superfamily protein
VIVAQMLHAPQARLDQLAVAFIVLRLLHFAAYLGDQSKLRSTVWFGSMICTVWIFVLGR